MARAEGLIFCIHEHVHFRAELLPDFNCDSTLFRIERFMASECFQVFPEISNKPPSGSKVGLDLRVP